MRRNAVTMKKNELRVMRGARMVLRPYRMLCFIFLVLPVLMNPPATLAQGADTAIDPVAIVRRASQNELHSSNGNHPFRYKLHKIDDEKITTKEIVETKDGDVARLIAVHDEPLTPEAAQAELDRLNTLMDHPEIQEHRHKREQEDSNR